MERAKYFNELAQAIGERIPTIVYLKNNSKLTDEYVLVWLWLFE